VAKQVPTPAPGLIDEGQSAAAFTLKDPTGQTHKLAGHRGGWVILYFYPRDNTPGCTIQACGFRDRYEALVDLAAAVFGVSPDDEASHRKFAIKYKLPFPLLIDPGQRVAKKYGVWQEKMMVGKKYMGIVRTTYLINPLGTVARRWDKVKVAGHVDEVAKALAQMT